MHPDVIFKMFNLERFARTFIRDSERFFCAIVYFHSHDFAAAIFVGGSAKQNIAGIESDVGRFALAALKNITDGHVNYQEDQDIFQNFVEFFHKAI